jgi:hypothetical protein
VWLNYCCLKRYLHLHQNSTIYLRVSTVSKAWGLQPIACWNWGFESPRRHGCLSVLCCVLSGRGLCDGPIPRPKESYRLWCVIVCDPMNENPLHLTWLGTDRSWIKKKERKKESFNSNILLVTGQKWTQLIKVIPCMTWTLACSL